MYNWLYSSVALEGKNWSVRYRVKHLGPLQFAINLVKFKLKVELLVSVRIPKKSESPKKSSLKRVPARRSLKKVPGRAFPTVWVEFESEFPRVYFGVCGGRRRGSINKNKKIVQLPSVDYPGVPLRGGGGGGVGMVTFDQRIIFLNFF